VLAYTGHEGGAAELAAVRAVLGGLDTARFVATEQSLLNRPTAPVLLLAWRRLDDPLGDG
jgi:hypothetical protein